MTNPNTLKNDSAITKFDDDKLDRQKFALQLRKIIENYDKDNKDCLTIGIMGPWGSGKSSLINMVLDQNKENILSKKRFKVMRFNPWNFTKQSDLYYQFFEQLKEIIVSNVNDKGKIKQTKDVVNKYWEKIRYNNTISFGYKGLVSYSKTLGDKPLETRKNELSKLLRLNRYKIIIVIDDIDRLTDEEVQQIFILVKAIADFPNIIYILPFDRKIVTPILNDLQEGYGEEFLNKIVQLQIDLPKISQSKVKDVFKKELESLIKSENIDFTSEERSIWLSTSFLTTPRDINRYINNLIFYLPLMKNEVNPLDYILLTGLQLFENEIYHEIQNNKTFFTKNLVNKPLGEISLSFNETYNSIINKRGKLSENTLKNILNIMFPQLNNLDKQEYNVKQIQEWNAQLRICSYKMFDKFFELTLGESEMSNTIFEMIIKSEDYDFIKQEVLANDEDGKSEQFLEKLMEGASRIKPENIKLFFRLLFDVGENLKLDTNDVFTKHALLLQNLGSLKRQVNDSKLYEAMKYGIENADEGLYLLVNELAINDKINQRYRFKDMENHHKKRLSDEQLDELEKIACSKIQKWADSGEIFKVIRANEVLYEWHYWDEKECESLIEKTIEDDEKIIELIEIFIKKVNNENDNIVDFEFNFDIMEELTPLEMIYNHIKEITPKLPDETDEKLVCESFIKEYENNMDLMKNR